MELKNKVDDLKLAVNDSVCKLKFQRKFKGAMGLNVHHKVLP